MFQGGPSVKGWNMGKKKLVKKPAPRRSSWRWVVAGGVLLVAVGAFCWFSEAQRPSGGTPRLVVDRSEIDLGYFPYGRWATAVFKLSNAGDGTLRLTEDPR